MYYIGKEEIEAVRKVIESKELFRVGGALHECDNFEKELCEKIGVKYSLLICGGGTAALTSSLAACKIGPGDEVLVPAYTWIATASAVLACGAIPVICEVDETLTIDPEDIKRKITPSTKAVIPVHMAGHPCEMDTICDIAKENGLYVIEDCCQDICGKYKGKYVGTWGDIGCFSFNYFKIITSGEGGCFFTNNEELFQRGACYCDCGSFFWSDIEFKFPVFVAQQYRANEIQGAIIREQLKKVDYIINELTWRRKMIMEELENEFDFSPSKDNDGDTGQNCPIMFRDEETARAWIKESGVPMGLGIDHGKHVYTNWTPLRTKQASHHPLMNPFNFKENQNLRADYDETVCPKTLEILKKTVFVPVDPDMTREEIKVLCDKLKEAKKRLGL